MKKTEQKKPSEFRRRAEKKLKSKITTHNIMSDNEMQQLIHELQVHQIELEMQNEELRKAQIELETSRAKYSDLYDFAPVGYFTFDKKGVILETNLTAANYLGVKRRFLIDKPFRTYILTEDRKIFDGYLNNVFVNESRQTCEIRLKKKSGSEFYAQLESMSMDDSDGNKICRTSLIDITERRKAEDGLRLAFNESRQRHAEISALLQGSSAVLRYNTFKDAAEAIFTSCKDIIGAVSGYIAMVSDDGTKNEVIYLDSGGMSCSVDPDLPMPIRGMRGEVFSSGKAIYHNDFSQSGWVHFLPEGHVGLENVLMAPMIVENNVIGIFGLGNKPGGFTDNDVRIAYAFSEFAAIALVNKRADEEIRKAKNALQKSNEELEKKVQERTKEIREKADLIDALFRYTATPLVLLDRDFNFLRVNKEYAKVCSKEIEEFYGHNHFKLYPNEENEAIFRRVVQTKTPFQAFVKPFTFPDHPEWGVTYWDWTLTPLLDSKGEVASLVFSLNDITERKKAEDDLKESQEKLRNLFAHLQLAVEAERTTIAREIHDEFGTILTALNIDLSWLEKKLPEDQHTLIERINKDIELVNSAVRTVQRIASELRPGVLDYLGLSSAVEWQVKEFADRTGIDWDIAVDMETSDLDKVISIALFRILQESLTNVSRHAGASKISVNLRETDSIVTLEVADDGKGITEEQLSDPWSLGILGLRERIQYLGGDIDIKGAPNKGTRVTVRVPLKIMELRDD